MLWGLSAHQINLPYSHLGALTAYLSPNIKEESGRQEHWKKYSKATNVVVGLLGMIVANESEDKWFGGW